MKVMEAQTKQKRKYRTKLFSTKEQIQMIISYCKFNIARECFLNQKKHLAGNSIQKDLTIDQDTILQWENIS